MGVAANIPYDLVIGRGGPNFYDLLDRMQEKEARMGQDGKDRQGARQMRMVEQPRDGKSARGRPLPCTGMKINGRETGEDGGIRMVKKNGILNKMGGQVKRWTIWYSQGTALTLVHENPLVGNMGEATTLNWLLAWYILATGPGYTMKAITALPHDG